MNFACSDAFTKSFLLTAVNTRIRHQPCGVVEVSFAKQSFIRRARRKNFQGVCGGMAGSLQLGQGGKRKIFVEEKFHCHTSDFHTFHGGQMAGEFEARADVQFLE